jgi:DNA-binding NarL/FixJ family response regulator
VSIRVVVADDHPVFRSGLRTLVEENPALTYVGEAADGRQAVEVCTATEPDVVLMDIRMPGVSGIDATRQILAARPDTAVLMLEDDTSVFAAMRAGARGYVLKGADEEQILRAVTAVATGEVIFGAAVATRMAAFFQSGQRSAAPAFPVLSSREHDILELIAGGLSNPAIAQRLALSEKTVATTCPTSSSSCGWPTGPRPSSGPATPVWAGSSGRPTVMTTSPARIGGQAHGQAETEHGDHPGHADDGRHKAARPRPVVSPI